MPKRRPTRGNGGRARPTKGSLTTTKATATPATPATAATSSTHLDQPLPAPGLSPTHPTTSGKNPAGLAKLKAKILGDDSEAPDPPERKQDFGHEESSQKEETKSPDTLPRQEAESLEECCPEMSSRNRPRNGGLKDDSDAHEETTMWNQIKKDIEKLGQLQKRQREVNAKILEMEDQMAKQLHVGVKETDELQALYREQVKLSSEESRMLNEEPTDLIRNIEILQALRTASSESSAQRNVPPSKVIRKPKAPKSETDGAADSPGPSPGLSISAARFKGNSVRSGSVASARDGRGASIKIEEGNDGGKGSSAERAGKFVKGAEVAYKQAETSKEDTGDWIQCIITKVIDTGNKIRYEVQDPEPDDPSASGAVYEASADALIAIPPQGAILPSFAPGKHVLARYPETTTFYSAEVTGVKKDSYRLKFEDDQNQEMEVDRRYVLEFSKR